jgi:SAM-dependent methyltransferase
MNPDVMIETINIKSPRCLLTCAAVSARYLALLWPESTLHHLSDNPLSSKSAPNICDIYSPQISSPLPELPNDFDAAYSMTLPAICREPDILKVLSNVNKCLRKGGIYHLLLMDPFPNTETLGKNMRAWFSNNLLLNLKAKSRCLTPSFVFPQALGQTSLRGPGSTRTTTKFYANPQSIRPRKPTSSAENGNETDGKEIRAELRSVVGRMLWREVWGGFVTSETWWWEDAACMQECLELGTFWEYHMIQAVKSN